MAGVPVGDTTLLQRLKELDERATPGPWVWKGVRGRVILGAESIIVADPVSFNPQDEEIAVEARNVLPAVVTLIEAAQRVVEEAGRYSVDGVPKSWAASRLHAALAPFVGEATQ